MRGTPSRVLRGSDLEFFHEEIKCRVMDNFAIQRGPIRPRIGEAATPDGGSHLSGRALQWHAKHDTGWLADPSQPVCSWQGVGVTRETVSELLHLAAVALSYPAHLVASHSLRKGGATAMLSVTDDIEVVKRFGGWKSDAAHAYLYTDMSGAPELARRMLRSKPVLQPQQSVPSLRDMRVGCARSCCYPQFQAPGAYRSRETPLKRLCSLPCCRHGCRHSTSRGPPAAASLDAVVGQRLGTSAQALRPLHHTILVLLLLGLEAHRPVRVASGRRREKEKAEGLRSFPLEIRAVSGTKRGPLRTIRPARLPTSCWCWRLSLGRCWSFCSWNSKQCFGQFLFFEGATAPTPTSRLGWLLTASEAKTCSYFDGYHTALEGSTDFSFSGVAAQYCCICGEANRLTRYGCNGCGAGGWRRQLAGSVPGARRRFQFVTSASLATSTQPGGARDPAG